MLGFGDLYDVVHQNHIELIVIVDFMDNLISFVFFNV